MRPENRFQSVDELREGARLDRTLPVEPRTVLFVMMARRPYRLRVAPPPGHARSPARHRTDGGIAGKHASAGNGNAGGNPATGGPGLSARYRRRQRCHRVWKGPPITGQMVAGGASSTAATPSASARRPRLAGGAGTAASSLQADWQRQRACRLRRKPAATAPTPPAAPLPSGCRHWLT